MIQSEYPDYDPSIALEFGNAATTSELTFMGIPLLETSSLWLLLFRFALNLLVCWIIIQLFYYKKSHRKDYYFTFMLFSVTVFLLIFLLDNVSMQIGFALGLFAIFSIIRYRTETVPIREMTYLFVVIGISVINGLAMTVSYAELLITNLLFIGTIWILESNKVLKHTSCKIVLYERIELITPDKEAELIADLKKRTGLDVTKVEVGHIDFLRDTAFVKIYYNSATNEINTIDNITRFS